MKAYSVIIGFAWIPFIRPVMKFSARNNSASSFPCMRTESPQSCLTLCDPMDCGPPGSSVYGIFQARILEWVAISFSKVSSWPRDQTHVSYVSCIAGRVFTTVPSVNPQLNMPHYINVFSWQATLHVRIIGTCTRCSGGRVKCVLSSATQCYQET